MNDAAEAAVVFDALLEHGVAEWPGVGRFALVALTKARMDHSPVVHVFPTRMVEFSAVPEFADTLTQRGGAIAFDGLGTVSADGFRPDEALLARLKVLPIQLFRAEVGETGVRVPRASTGAAEPPRDERGWWRRIFGID